MSSKLTERRKGYMKKAQDVAKETNNIRGLLSFVSRKNKKSTYKNKLIEELKSNGMYENIYNKYIKYIEDNDKDDIKILNKYLGYNEFKILELLEFVEPENLDTQKEGSYIQEIPLNF